MHCTRKMQSRATYHDCDNVRQVYATLKCNTSLQKEIDCLFDVCVRPLTNNCPKLRTKDLYLQILICSTLRQI